MRAYVPRQIDLMTASMRQLLRVGWPLAFGLCSVGGCANFWDDVTAPGGLKNMFVHKDPVAVLRDSTDGDDRARALRALKEPMGHGGSDADQDAYMNLMTKTAAQDRQPLCRLMAVQRLSESKDPRAVKALQDAFYNSGDFAPEIATRIQCQTLSAMGETGNPAVVKFLVEKLKEPPAERSDLAQQRTDRCIAAARALAHFHDTQGNEALAEILRKEKEDVALRERAHESLQESTGQKLPAEYQAWDNYLHHKNDRSPTEQSHSIVPAAWRSR